MLRSIGDCAIHNIATPNFTTCRGSTYFPFFNASKNSFGGLCL